jgi:hypothetical protein
LRKRKILLAGYLTNIENNAKKVKLLQAEKINQLLKALYDKDTTTKDERNALLEACGCVWESRANKVADTGSFMNMLYEHMRYRYDVDVKTTETETVFYVKTFYKKSHNQDMAE